MTPDNLSEKFKRATEIICKQGLVPFPATATAERAIRLVVGDNAAELDLIEAFQEDPSQTLEQLVESSGMDAGRITRLADSLAQKGLIFNQPNSRGVMVYRLLPLMIVGLMEYRFMGPISGSSADKEMAQLFEQMLEELRAHNQGHYDEIVTRSATAPAVDRTVPAGETVEGRPIRVIPVEKSVENIEEFILPSQSVEAIIDKFEDIAVGNCFCRQRRTLLGEPCRINAPMMNCFTFGKSARHTSAQGFAKLVSREEARKILKEATQAGLIHKTLHPGSREDRPETSICNCCKDCCDTLRLWRNGTLPMINSTFHLAQIDTDACTGCGTCVEWCPTEAIALNDEGLAQRDESACLGCGVCARFCPEAAISLKQGLRRVCVLPPRLRSA